MELSFSMHLKRWLTGIVAIPILIYIIGPGPRWLFCLILFITSLAGLVEFYKIAASDLPTFIRRASYFLTLLLFIVLYRRQILLAPLIIALWAFVPMTFFMFTRHSHNNQLTADISKSIFGPIYVGLPLAMMMMIHLRPSGNIWIFFLLVVMFANDTGAFYFGKLFGRHKLFKAISPGKTWEGALGGLICSVIAALWFLHILGLHPIGPGIITLVFALSSIGQIGDLAESMLKRNHGVKDSGKILPGHGGILDRIDGLLFSTPLLYIFLNYSIP